MDKAGDKQNKKRVLVGMSGGIDSSAACLMLQEQGYEVVGVTMRTWDLPQQFSPGDEQPHFIREAQKLAGQLGIEHHIADMREEFKAVIVKNFIDEYLNGRTPNPCVMCNPLFKFRILTEWADRLGCPYVATGHYVQTEKGENGHTYLKIGRDKRKDQSYFLWRVGEEVLERCLFPLGKYTKEEVRGYLQEKGFATKAAEGESMEICFVEGDYRHFLRQQMPDLDTRIGPGKFVDTEGRTLGTHRGYAYYTVGQRKGLEIALGYPAYVVKLNPSKNTVMLGGEDALKTRWMLTENPVWTDDQGNDCNHSQLAVRIRYRSTPLPCTVEKLDDGRLLVKFTHEEASAITPGQSAVFYIGERVVGGAFIDSQRGIGAYKK